MSTRSFSVSEANRFLPEIQALLSQIRETVQGFEDYRRAAGLDAERAHELLLDRIVPLQYFSLVALFNQAMSRIRDIGCEIKDVARGLVDFPTMIAGEQAYLCWEEGEDRIRFWHDLEAGYAGRQPLPEDDEAPPA